jgi:hypothetical protein
MILIIAGSRLIDEVKAYEIITREIEHLGIKDQITEIVSGGAQGVDLAGEKYAKNNKIAVKRFLPDWSKGPGAGPMRNKEMAQYGDELLAIWDGASKGTKNMMDHMYRKKKHVHLVKV